MLQAEEGRDLSEYVLVCWDGNHICFGRFDGEMARWGRLARFDEGAAQRLLSHIEFNGAPLVHPQLLSKMVGPESAYGAALIPAFFEAIRRSIAAENQTNKTRLLFTEWRRLFGQVAGAQSERLRALLQGQGESHNRPYGEDPAAYLFALNTYIAVVAKLVAALSLPNGSQDLTDANVAIQTRIEALESGEMFRAGGISNMLAGDFFSWYHDDAHWPTFAPLLSDLLTALSSINFDVTRKSPDSTRDLFKGMYQSLFRELSGMR